MRVDHSSSCGLSRKKLHDEKMAAWNARCQHEKLKSTERWIEARMTASQGDSVLRRVNGTGDIFAMGERHYYLVL